MSMLNFRINRYFIYKIGSNVLSFKNVKDHVKSQDIRYCFPMPWSLLITLITFWTDKQRKSICSGVSELKLVHEISQKWWNFPFKTKSHNKISVLSYNDHFDYAVGGGRLYNDSIHDCTNDHLLATGCYPKVYLKYILYFNSSIMKWHLKRSKILSTEK